MQLRPIALAALALFAAAPAVAAPKAKAPKPADKPYVAPTQPPEAPAANADDTASDTCPAGTTLHKTKTERYCFRPNYAKEGRWTHWYDSGQKKAETEYVNGKRHGVRVQWYENGNKKEESRWKDDKEDGLASFWDKEGRATESIEYRDGKKHGQYGSWEKGLRREESMWDNGQRSGKTAYYFDDGKTRSEEVDYKAGKTNGKHTWNHQNGKNKVEMTFAMGRKNGLQVEYTLQGAFFQAVCFRDTAEMWRTQNEADARAKACD